MTSALNDKQAVYRRALWRLPDAHYLMQAQLGRLVSRDAIGYEPKRSIEAYATFEPWDGKRQECDGSWIFVKHGLTANCTGDRFTLLVVAMPDVDGSFFLLTRAAS